MKNNKDLEFPGIPNRALLEVMRKTLHDGAFLKAAGHELPEFKPVKHKQARQLGTSDFKISNAGLADYLRVSLEISQKANELRSRGNPELKR